MQIVMPIAYWLLLSFKGHSRHVIGTLSIKMLSRPNLS